MMDLRQKVEELKSLYLDFWKAICRMETPTTDKNALNKQADFIENFCKERGFGVKRNQYQKAGDTLVVAMEGTAQKAPVALMAHMDTVHAPGAFGESVVREENGVLYGPGVFDCKGGIAMSLLTMEALRESGAAYGPVKLILNSDEENGSLIGKEAAEFIQKEAQGACAVFNAEAGCPEFMTVGRKGIVAAEIQVNGIPGHAGNAYFECASAIREAAYKIIALETQSDDNITYNCATIQGGTTRNAVPGECRIVVDIRFRNEAQQKQAMEVLDTITRKNYVEGCHSTWRITKVRPAMECTQGNMELFRLVQQTADALGLPHLESQVRGGGSDSAYTVQIGIPTVCSMGPVGRNEHTVREEADIATLSQRALLLAECIVKVG